MRSPPEHVDVTGLATRARTDQKAADELFEILEPVIRDAIKWRMNSNASSIQVTEVVNDVYLIFRQRMETIAYEDRKGLLSTLATRIRTFFAKERRHHGRFLLACEPSLELLGIKPETGTKIDPTDFERAWEKLERLDIEAAEILEMSSFTPMTLKEIAETVGLGLTRVKDKKAWARMKLREYLGLE